MKLKKELEAVVQISELSLREINIEQRLATEQNTGLKIYYIDSLFLFLS